MLRVVIYSEKVCFFLDNFTADFHCSKAINSEITKGDDTCHEK